MVVEITTLMPLVEIQHLLCCLHSGMRVVDLNTHQGGSIRYHTGCRMYHGVRYILAPQCEVGQYCLSTAHQEYYYYYYWDSH